MPTSLPFVIEPMTLADINDVMEIERVAFSAPWSPRAYRYEIAHKEHSTMLVIRRLLRSGGRLGSLFNALRIGGRGPVVAYGGFWLLVDEAHICTIAVAPDERGQGLGELLLLALLEWGAGRGARRATLEVRISNEAAHRLYHKVGFEAISLRRHYYADNNEDAYIMATESFDSSEYRAYLDRRRAQLYHRLVAESSAPRRWHNATSAT